MSFSTPSMTQDAKSGNDARLTSQFRMNLPMPTAASWATGQNTEANPWSSMHYMPGNKWPSTEYGQRSPWLSLQNGPHDSQLTSMSAFMGASPVTMYNAAKQSHTSSYMSPWCMEATNNNSNKPVDIEVVGDRHDNQNMNSDNVKISWNSVEQLANSLFPSTDENVTVQLEELHHGCLNHKSAIQKLHKTTHKLQQNVRDHRTFHDIHSKNISDHKEVLNSQNEKLDKSLLTQLDMQDKFDTHTQALENHKHHLQEVRKESAEANRKSSALTLALKSHKETLEKMRENNNNCVGSLRLHSDAIQSIQKEMELLKKNQYNQKNGIGDGHSEVNLTQKLQSLTDTTSTLLDSNKELRSAIRTMNDASKTQHANIQSAVSAVSALQSKHDNLHSGVRTAVKELDQKNEQLKKFVETTHEHMSTNANQSVGLNLLGPRRNK